MIIPGLFEELRDDPKGLGYAALITAKNDQGVADQTASGKRGDDHGDHPGRRNEHDVDLGVAEDPEQVLPEQRVAAGGRVEEMRTPVAVQVQHQRADEQRREPEDHRKTHNQQRPQIHRHVAQ